MKEIRNDCLTVNSETPFLDQQKAVSLIEKRRISFWKTVIQVVISILTAVLLFHRNGVPRN